MASEPPDQETAPHKDALAFVGAMIDAIGEVSKQEAWDALVKEWPSFFRAPAPAEPSAWNLVSRDGLPPPHERYLVRRNGLFFTVTPCYGMHNPWWVVRTMPETWPNEADPVPVEDTDEWMPLPVERPRP